MFTILILSCLINDPSDYGCGPRSHILNQMVTVGTANSEAECFMKGNKELPKYTDTDKIFHKVICTKGN